MSLYIQDDLKLVEILLPVSLSPGIPVIMPGSLEL